MGQMHVRAAQGGELESLRRRYLERGDLPEGGLSASVLRSWERCQRLGLEIGERGRPANTTRADLMLARERNLTLLNHAGGVMEHLYEQIRASGSMVLLADASGLILHGIGDPSFVDRASRVALQPGASWSECQRGTNAIGATLIERAPVEIFGAEHYLECNGVLTCSAAPIFDSKGVLLGALDISGDHRKPQPHTLGLARMGVRLVERRMFESEHARHALFAFHNRPEGVGGLQEGLLAVDADGEIVAADRQARMLLGIEDRRIGRLGAFGNLFRSGFGTVISRAGRDPAALMELELRDGARMFARVRVSPAWSANAHAASSARARVAQGQDPSRSARQRITLETLATGDAGLQFTLDRCAKVIGRKIPVLIQGESGSGKELLARACHNSGPRADGPFVAVNCAAIPEHLIESELFGYVGGAFTGARKEGAIGRIQQADGGTLFLDEIGDMPLAMQARLLRVLQERCVQPVGGSEPVAVDIALLCATHRNLGDLARAGQFREDLYYRVNGLTAMLPPLRERTDLHQIVRRLIDGSSNHPEPRAITVDASAMRLLEAYAWPGNIRQLQNVLEVALALLDAHEERILPEHLPEEVQGASPVTRVAAAAPASASAMSPATLPLRGRRPKDIDDAMIREALERFEGNLSAAARHLGVARNTLYRRMGCDY
ncbi:MAG TPA: sigma-54-dependent Fis family transcriptional regulator [Thauera sp.]|nr:sigma-54-dependent Fis family transcriptional regulator [Thauera sp.]